jgi:hypothetical protein
VIGHRSLLSGRELTTQRREARQVPRYPPGSAPQYTRLTGDHGPPEIIIARADSAKESRIVYGAGGASAVQLAAIS